MMDGVSFERLRREIAELEKLQARAAGTGMVTMFMEGLRDSFS